MPSQYKGFTFAFDVTDYRYEYTKRKTGNPYPKGRFTLSHEEIADDSVEILQNFEMLAISDNTPLLMRRSPIILLDAQSLSRTKGGAIKSNIRNHTEWIRSNHSGYVNKVYEGDMYNIINRRSKNLKKLHEELKKLTNYILDEQYEGSYYLVWYYNYKNESSLPAAHYGTRR